MFAFRFIVLAFRFFVFAFLPPLRNRCGTRVSEGKKAVYLLFTLYLPVLSVDKLVGDAFCIGWSGRVRNFV